MSNTIFYDGNCGLCHWFAGAVVRRDRRNVFRYAPLGGSTFNAAVPVERRADLPDSVVVRTAEGHLLIRSAAVLYVLDQLGGHWSTLTCVVHVIPASLRDAAYNVVARIRRSLWRTPADKCPALSRDLMSRFDP